MKRPIRYHVAPRYSPGSPAMVSQEIAEMVCEDEKRCYEHALEGAYGEAERERAKREGLAGIVEERQEMSKHWKVRDMITREVFDRPFPDNRSKVAL